MSRLTEFEPKFFRVTERGEQDVATLAEAQGITFVCPECANGHSTGVLFRDRGVPDNTWRNSCRWTASGTSYEDLTLSPSVDGGSGCWHGFIQNGDVTSC